MTAMLTADWFQLDSYYRKIDLYVMNWNIEEGLDSMLISGSPYGGPVAVVRDKKQLVRILTQVKPVITIYNCIGNVISKIVLNSGPMLTFGWSDQEDLMCVQESGDVLIYDMFGAYQRSFSMGQEARDTKIREAQFFQSPQGIGLAIITSSNRMFLVVNVNEPKVKSLPDLPRPSVPATCWCVLSTTKAVVGLLLCRDKEIFQCEQGEERPTLLKPVFKNLYTQIRCIAISQNGNHIALFTDSGYLWMGSSDFKKKYCEINTGYLKDPNQLMWCGNQAVTAHWDDVLVVYGVSGNSVSFPYDGPFHLVPECDCIRILSETTHELLQKVPPVVEKIFRINSTAPASYLLEASRQYQKKSHRADEYIRLVKPDLVAAVQDCIDAACLEFEPETQKMLIRAAQFGKSFMIDPVHTDIYVNTCRWLRVLNNIRNPKIAIPLTYIQAETLGPHVLLDRLIWRRLHCLASHIASYLQIKDGQNRVLTHWACYKVAQSHLDNETTARDIAEKLRNVPGISYTIIAMRAADKGRKALAIKIVEYETCARRQVPLLLALGEGTAALRRAQMCGDTDLIYVVLLHLKDKMGKRDFELCIRGFPLAQSLYIQYCRKNAPAAYRAALEQHDDWRAQAACHVRDAISDAATSPVASLLTAAECCRKHKDDISYSIIEDYRKLIKQQSSLIETYGDDFRDLSVHDTAEKLLMKGEVKLADKLRSEYKIPERRYWWLRLQTLAARKEWGELEKFSKSKKSLIGYEPFVDICIKHKNNNEALKYLPRCREDIKVKYYVKAEFYEEAAQVAFEQRNLNALLYVQGKCPAHEIGKLNKINTLLEQMNTRK